MTDQIAEPENAGAENDGPENDGPGHFKGCK